MHSDTMPRLTKPPAPTEPATHSINTAPKAIDASTKAARLLIAQRAAVKSVVEDGQFVRVRADVLCALLDCAAPSAARRQAAKEPAQPRATGRNRLSEDGVRNLRAPGRYGDGGGLYLEILPTGARRWLFRYQMRGRRRDMILGAVTQQNGLGAARQAAQAARELIAKGKDPLDERRRLRERRERAMPAPRSPTPCGRR
ncbi:MAG TPA: Arm DNA-binding domain-containing protein [Caulobacteraceae bacterium]